MPFCTWGFCGDHRRHPNSVGILWGRRRKCVRPECSSSEIGWTSSADRPPGSTPKILLRDSNALSDSIPRITLDLALAEQALAAGVSGRFGEQSAA